MSFLSNSLLSVFVIFYKFREKAWSPSLNAWKATVAFSIIIGWLFLAIVVLFNIITGKEFLIHWDRWEAKLTFLPILLFNYIWLVGLGHGVRYVNTYSTLSIVKQRKILIKGIATCLVVIVFAVAIAAINIHLNKK